MLTFAETQSNAAMEAAIGRRLLALIRPGVVDFASGGGKKCTKGLSCGGSCISKAKVCIKAMNPAQKQEYRTIVKAVKAGGEGADKAMKDFKAGLKPEVSDAEKELIAAKADKKKAVAPAEVKAETAKEYSADDFYKVGGFGPTAIPPTQEQLLKEFKGISIIEDDADKPGGEITSLQNKSGTEAQVRASAEEIANRMNQLKSPPSEDGLSASLKAERAGKPIRSQDDFDSALDKVMANPDFDAQIYIMRRAMGDRLTRQDFDKYLFGAQAAGRIQLYSGSLNASYPPGILDSVSSKVSGLRTKVKLKKTTAAAN